MPNASQLAHEGLPVQNPLSLADLDAGINRLALAPGARILDIGSGAGELLRRIVERWPGTSGLGIDLLAADPVHPSVELREGDAGALGDETFDLVCCVGSIHALGDGVGAYRRLGELAPKVLLGDGYWRHEPDPAYLEALGASADELPDRRGLDDLVRSAGLRPTWSAEASVADLTAYEEALLANADTHPDRADVVAYAAAIRAWRAAPGGTDTLGFALLLLERA